VIVARRGFLVSFAVIGREDSGVHRIRNWAEDLHRQAQQNGWGTVEKSDNAVDRVCVVASSPRDLGNLAGAVKRSLKHHKLLDDAVVEKLSGSAHS
jgi:hypothetical protein